MAIAEQPQLTVELKLINQNIKLFEASACGTMRWLIYLSRGSAAIKVCCAKHTLYTIGKSREKNHMRSRLSFGELLGSTR